VPSSPDTADVVGHPDAVRASSTVATATAAVSDRNVLPRGRRAGRVPANIVVPCLHTLASSRVSARCHPQDARAYGKRTRREDHGR